MTGHEAYGIGRAGRFSPTRLAGAKQVQRRLICLAACLALASCGIPQKRSPVPAGQIEDAAPYGIVAKPLRFWGDGVGESKIQAIKSNRTKALKRFFGNKLHSGARLSEDMIAFSGGGPDGAYGAGLMRGWTERGDRPDFSLVTGISTGAVVALFTFLGPDYDETLREIFSNYDTEALFTPAIFSALTGGPALGDSEGYRRLIAKYVTADVVARIAREFARGRVLLIGTTNLDAARPMIWDVTQVAASGHPKALELVHEIIRGSSAIPAALPPAVIPVIGTDGKRYDEVHVDGGAVTQVTLMLPQISLRDFDEALGVTIDRRAYVVVNNELVERYDPVELELLSITKKAVGSLIGGSDLG
ncbi:MAG: patatin-like phospholipase family protein, partial [Pseudomonadota bacterium]